MTVYSHSGSQALWRVLPNVLFQLINLVFEVVRALIDLLLDLVGVFHVAAVARSDSKE